MKIDSKSKNFKDKCQNILSEISERYRSINLPIPELAIIERGELIYTNNLISIFTNSGIKTTIYTPKIITDDSIERSISNALCKNQILFLDGAKHSNSDISTLSVESEFSEFMDTWEYESDIGNELNPRIFNELFYINSNTIIPFKILAIFKLLKDNDIDIYSKTISIIGFGFDALTLAIPFTKEGGIVEIIHPGCSNDYTIKRLENSDIIINLYERLDYTEISFKNDSVFIVPNGEFKITDRMKENLKFAASFSNSCFNYECGMIIYNYIKILINRFKSYPESNNMTELIEFLNDCCKRIEND